MNKLYWILGAYFYSGAFIFGTLQIINAPTWCYIIVGFIASLITMKISEKLKNTD